MPYLVKADSQSSELPAASVKVEAAERAEQEYRSLRLDGYKSVYVITPDGRRFNHFDKAMAANEDQNRIIER